MSQVSPDVPAAKLLAFRADSELVRAIEDAAKRNDRSVSGEIRQALRAYLELQDEEAAA